MPLYSADALVLRTYKLGEADRIVVFLTRDRGKKRGVAQSARRPRSRFAGALEPLTEVRVAYFEKEQRELVSLNYAEPVRSPLSTPNPDALGYSAYFAELIDACAADADADERLFRLGVADARGGDRRRRRSSRWPATSSAGCCACRGCIRRKWPAASAAREFGAGDGAFLAADGHGFVCRSCHGAHGTDDRYLSAQALAFLQAARRVRPSEAAALGASPARPARARSGAPRAHRRALRPDAQVGAGRAGPDPSAPLGRIVTFQDLILKLSAFWASRGCLIQQPLDLEVGAGTSHPETLFRVLGPEHWQVAYVQPSRRPDDGRFGQNPNRLFKHHQFQVILKPSPDEVQQIYLDSLEACGINPRQHDIRFEEDNWESPALGAWGIGWQVMLDGLEITQFTYFQQVGGVDLAPVAAEITYGLERIAMFLQKVDNVFDLEWAPGVTYGEVRLREEVEQSRYAFNQDTGIPAADVRRVPPRAVRRTASVRRRGSPTASCCCRPSSTA